MDMDKRRMRQASEALKRLWEKTRMEEVKRVRSRRIQADIEEFMKTTLPGYSYELHGEDVEFKKDDDVAQAYTVDWDHELASLPRK